MPVSNREVNMAGEALVNWRGGDNEELFDSSFDKVFAFRATHAYPLRVSSTILGQRADKIDPEANVYSRIKRVSSIISKLRRIRTMQVTTMHDLGGCRAVVNTIDHVNELARQFREIKPRLDDPKEYNYIESPKPDGYRSIHFVVKYKSNHPKYVHLPSRRVELQIRSQLQHKWATALETIDLFTEQTLKSGGGAHYWKRFFVLTSSLFALQEHCPVVPNSVTNYNELVQEARGLWNGLRIRDQFDGWITATQVSIPRDHGTNAMYLIEVDTEKKTTGVKVFANVVQAYSEYGETEKKNQFIQGRTAVLVSTGKIDRIRNAFPSYYGDTKDFLNEVERIVRL